MKNKYFDRKFKSDNVLPFWPYQTEIYQYKDAKDNSVYEPTVIILWLGDI